MYMFKYMSSIHSEMIECESLTKTKNVNYGALIVEPMRAHDW
jgi:hypothetical protein